MNTIIIENLIRDIRGNLVLYLESLENLVSIKKLKKG